MNILIKLSLILFVLAIDANDSSDQIKSRVISDPEIALCDELTIDAAVVADDGIGYVFKGNFFWKIDITTGISQQLVAQYISDRWEGLTGPIDAAFSIDEEKYRLSTVFIKENKWFLYSKQKLRANGTTDNWPYVIQKPMMSAFEYFDKNVRRKDIGVYLMYENDDFSKYIFQDIQNPTYVTSGKAYNKGRFLSFLNDPTDDSSGTFMSSHIKPLAVISNTNGIVVFGDEEICVAKIAVIPYCNETTDGSVVHKYYGCPRKPFPTTIPTTSKTTTTTSTTTTTTRRSPLVPPYPPVVTHSTFTTETDSVTNEQNVENTEHSMETTREQPLTDRSDRFINSFLTYAANDGKASTPSQINDEKKFNFWPYVIAIAIIAIIVVIILFVVIFFVRKRNNGQKQKQRIKSKKTAKKQQNKDIDIIINKSKKTIGSGNKSLSDKSEKSVSLRSNDEALGANTRLNDPSDEEVFGQIEGKTSSNVEADQIIHSIKSNEGIE